MRIPTRPTLIMALSLLLAAPAAAQDRNAEQAMQGGGMTDDRQLDDARAREHYQIATRYYDEGRFVEAAGQFEEAYELSGRSELLYNAYIAYRDAHQSRQAAAMLQRYLEAVPNAEDRVNLEARLAELERAVEQDETEAAQLTDAERRAQEEARRADEEAAARREAEAEPEVWPWIIAGIGGGALIAGAVVGGLALGDATALRSDCDSGGLCDPSEDLDERRSGIQTLALVSDVLLFGGGAIAAAGVILGLLYGLGGPSEAEPTVDAMCTGQGCHMSVRGVF